MKVESINQIILMQSGKKHEAYTRALNMSIINALWSASCNGLKLLGRSYELKIKEHVELVKSRQVSSWTANKTLKLC